MRSTDLEHNIWQVSQVNMHDLPLILGMLLLIRAHATHADRQNSCLVIKMGNGGRTP